MSAQVEFNASIYVSEQLNRQLVNMCQDLAYRAVGACAEKYNFDAEEAYRYLNLSMIKVERKGVVKVKTEKTKKVCMPKSSFPLPYNGEFHENCCYALRQNNGLYTQCTGVRKGESKFCKSCCTTMQKTGAESPEYGTIQMRNAVGIFEYTDPKGRKPVCYRKVMKKYKISEEQVEEEAGKLNMKINKEHYVMPAEEGKRGRPKTEKEAKAKGAKGRPKKEKKVLMIEGDDDDLFAALVAEANDESLEMEKKKPSKTDEEKEAERLAKEAEKAEKEAKRLAEKAEKEAKLAAEKAEKEAKRLAEKAEKEAKLAAEKAEKEAKKLAAEQAKAEKEAKLASEKKQKEAKKPEPEIVKKLNYEGKKYLLSKQTNIVYDYEEYVKSREQIIIGKWNEELQKLEFNEVEDEEKEEQYEL